MPNFHKHKKLHPDLEKLIKEKEKIKAKITKKIIEVRKTCKHEVIAEVPWESLGEGFLRERAICLHCRLEKEKKFGYFGELTVFPNPQTVIKITPRHKFYQLRID